MRKQKEYSTTNTLFNKKLVSSLKTKSVFLSTQGLTPRTTLTTSHLSPFFGFNKAKNGSAKNTFFALANENGSVMVDSVVVKNNNNFDVNTIQRIETLTYHLDNYNRSNQDTCILHRPSVMEGQWVQSGDLLADCATSSGGELALGQNLLIAYMPWEGYNFEDAILISERLVYDELYTSIHIERYETETKESKLGFEEITRNIPEISENEKNHLDKNGIASLGSSIEEGDILVGKITPINKKSQSPYQKLLYTILEKEFLPFRDSSLRAPKGIRAKVIKVNITPEGSLKENKTKENNVNASLGTSIFASSKNKNWPLFWTQKNRTKTKMKKRQQLKRNQQKKLYQEFAFLKQSFSSKEFSLNSLFSLNQSRTLELSAEKRNINYPQFNNKSTYNNLLTIPSLNQTNQHLSSQIYSVNVSVLHEQNGNVTKPEYIEKETIAYVNNKSLSSLVNHEKENFKTLLFPLEQTTQHNTNKEKSSSNITGTDFIAEKNKTKKQIIEILEQSKSSSALKIKKRNSLRKALSAYSTNNLIKAKSSPNKTTSTGNTLLFVLNKLNQLTQMPSSSLVPESLNQKLKTTSFTKGKNRSLKTNAKLKQKGTFIPILKKKGLLQGKKTFLLKNLLISFFHTRHINLVNLLKSNITENQNKVTNTIHKVLLKSMVKTIQNPKLTLFVNQTNFMFVTPSNLGNTLKTPVTQSIVPKSTKKTLTTKTNIGSKNSLQEKKTNISVQLYLAIKRKVQVGDKLSGRHGNKGIISQILPREDMPFLPDGTPIDMVLNPLGVPSRMNVGQIYECLLGLAGKYLGENFKVFPFDEIYGPEASRSFVYSKLHEASVKSGFKWLFNPSTPGKIRLYDGRTGDCFDQAITVGKAYILRLVHMVDDKIHARSTGPYSLVTQQPLRGRSKQGGQRLGEMEVWALEGYGAAFTLLEMLTIKSDDMTGRMTLWSNLILNKEISIGTPESFKVLICELQALCLDIGLFRQKNEFSSTNQKMLENQQEFNNSLLSEKSLTAKAEQMRNVELGKPLVEIENLMNLP